MEVSSSLLIVSNAKIVYYIYMIFNGINPNIFEITNPYSIERISLHTYLFPHLSHCGCV